MFYIFTCYVVYGPVICNTDPAHEELWTSLDPRLRIAPDPTEETLDIKANSVTVSSIDSLFSSSFSSVFSARVFCFVLVISLVSL